MSEVLAQLEKKGGGGGGAYTYQLFGSGTTQDTTTILCKTGNLVFIIGNLSSISVNGLQLLEQTGGIAWGGGIVFPLRCYQALQDNPTVTSKNYTNNTKSLAICIE